MSLIQHVSAVEGVDQDPAVAVAVAALDDNISLRLSRQPSISLSITYDPLPGAFQAQAPEKLEPIAAYEVSSGKRIAQIVVGVLSCVTASGIVFGFDALKSILVDEGVYRSLCTEEELQDQVRLCYLQDQRLNLTFIVASVTTNVSALLVGSILDRYGPRVCGLASSVLVALGSLCMGFANNAAPFFDGYMAGSFLLALGGTFTFVPSFHLSNAFPRMQGLILALVTGAFDASASVFLLFRLLYRATDGEFGVRHIFVAYLIVPLLIFVSQLTLMPAQSYETRGELTSKMEQAQDPTQDVHDSDDDLDTAMDVMRVRSARADQRRRSIVSINDLLGTPAQQDRLVRRDDQIRVNSGVWGVLHGLPASKQIQTPWFILMTLFTVLQMARFNFFIATIWSQYVYMLDSAAEATRVIEYFDIALPIGGIATVPFIGALLDHASTVAVLNLLVLLSTLIGVLGAVPTVWAAYSNVTLFVLFRPLYYSAMSDYAAKVFGYATFGTVYGAIICLSGVFTFTQSGLQALLHHVFEDDPEPINLGLATVGVILGVALVMYVDIQGRAIQRDRAFVAAGYVPSNFTTTAAGTMTNAGAAAAIATGGGAGTASADERTRLLAATPPRLARLFGTNSLVVPFPNGLEGGGGTGTGTGTGIGSNSSATTRTDDNLSGVDRRGLLLRSRPSRSALEGVMNLSTVEETPVEEIGEESPLLSSADHEEAS